MNKDTSNVELWYNDFSILLKKETLFEFWPRENMNYEQKINAISRFIIYITLIGFFVLKNYKVVITGLIALVTLILVYNFLKKKEKNKVKENFSDSEIYKKVKHNFTTPIVQNPIMNTLLPEIQDNPNKLPAAPSYNSEVKKEINNSVKEIIKQNFYDDPKNNNNILQQYENQETEENQENNIIKSDLEISMRQFYTTPNTLIPNNQKEFAKFCYGNMAQYKDTMKENNSQ
jgi:hypothetical protein